MPISRDQNRALNSRENFILSEVCGILDLAEKWESHFSKWPSRSNVGGYLAKLCQRGLIVNIAGAGNKGSTGDLKAAWYVHADCVDGLSPEAMHRYDMLLRPGTAIRARYDAHVTRMRASRWNRSVPPKVTPAPTPAPTPKITPVPAPTPEPPKAWLEGTPMESIHTECELLVMWMREWNVKSLAISDKGVVELSCAPTKSPELKVTFRYDKP